MELSFGGHQIVLLPERAVFMPSANALILSDVHLGSTQLSRTNGFPPSVEGSHDDLDRLDALAHLYGADLYIVGDLVHSAHREQWPRFEEVRRTWPNHVVLIAGNHYDYCT